MRNATATRVPRRIIGRDNLDTRDSMQLEMRGVNCEMDDALKDHVERRLRFALGRLAARIGRMTVLLSDVNGPRGGIDKRCRIVVTLVPRGMVRVEGSGDE